MTFTVATFNFDGKTFNVFGEVEEVKLYLAGQTAKKTFTDFESIKDLKAHLQQVSGKLIDVTQWFTGKKLIRLV